MTVQIVPLDVTNASAPNTPITYLRFGGLDLPDVVYLEHIRSANFLEDRDETEEYRIALDRLADEALTPPGVDRPAAQDDEGTLRNLLSAHRPIEGRHPRERPPWTTAR